LPITAVEALELSQLLGSLLAAVVDAQAQAARATVAFVEDVGFETAPEGERLRNVKLRYSKKDENGQVAEFEVEVPLLALVNVPSLAVQQAKFTLSYDVVTATQTSSSGGSALPASSTFAPVAKLTGFLRKTPASSTPESDRRTTAVDLEVTLEQQAIPVGVERIFDLAELGITERPASPTG
jgi:hypothetical protein